MRNKCSLVVINVIMCYLEFFVVVVCLAALLEFARRALLLLEPLHQP
jgi:hypothetical protein